ncbi:17847_t:CDS:2 [Gigaspora margarita]|uniref:17847_t:CDS:1 n=1 Tax=Gigaspora margarita TaxID=4874 RepID=A0ABN7V6K1_GIGMA|nr:17847_t:CDS:2 [Gigaspora margarita]
MTKKLRKARVVHVKDFFEICDIQKTLPEDYLCGDIKIQRPYNADTFNSEKAVYTFYISETLSYTIIEQHKKIRALEYNLVFLDIIFSKVNIFGSDTDIL